MFTFNHFNFNVFDLERSLKFYDEALGLKPVREKNAADGRYKIVFLGDGRSPFRLELTWLRDRTEPYDLGEQEYHLALAAPPTKSTPPWAASALKTPRWASTSSRTRTATGLRSSRPESEAHNMQDILIVVDMQNDFIDGALGTPEAVAIVPAAAEKIRSFPGPVLFTRDTHTPDYLNTQEGRNLPVVHCVRGTPGWELRPELQALCRTAPIDKPTFGSAKLGELLLGMDREDPIASVTLIGLCTDICVISNALLVKAFLPEVPVTVDAACCAGVTPESHRNALAAMKMCQIAVENE